LNTSQIQIIYIVLFGLYLFTEITLVFLNIKEAQKNQHAVPKDFSNYIDLETYQKSVAYSLAKARFGLVSLVFSSIVTLLFIFSGWFGALETLVASLQYNAVTTGVIFILFTSLLLAMIELPFSYYSTFILEERFGFNRTNLKTWISDLLKQSVLSVVLGGALLYFLLWFMQSSGQFWWVYAFVFIAVFQLVIMFIFPVWIAPLFNKFENLKDKTLEEELMSMASRVKFPLTGVFQMDGSKRSAHANAYFTGFGRNKRIVLYDTLISLLNRQELLSVIAHEMGHQKLGHLPKMLIISLSMMFIGLFLLSLLIAFTPFYSAFGFTAPSNHAALIVFSLASSPITYFISPIFSSISRKHEYEADRFARDLASDWQPLAGGLLKLAKNSLSNLTPHWLYSFFHYSHPTLAERIKKLKS
jgi:STE24 endopeptidase